MYEDNVLLLITALAQDASDEYRHYKKILSHKTLSRKEREYYNLRAEEALNFFNSQLFTLAFPNKKEYIVEELRKEKVE